MLRNLLAIGLLALLISGGMSAQGSELDPVCTKLVESRGYQKRGGDTIYWETKVLPDYERIAKDPQFKTEAILNAKFKAMLAAYGVREKEISDANQNRILADCRSNPQAEGCLAMQTYCVKNYVAVQYPKTAENFLACANPDTAPKGCGSEFQTKEGVERNLGVLKRVEKKFAEIDAHLKTVPNSPAYLRDIDATVGSLSERARKRALSGKTDLEAATRAELEVARKRHQVASTQKSALGEACRAFNECKGYLTRKEVGDDKHLLNQISSCRVKDDSTPASGKQFDAAMRALGEVHSKTQRKSLAELARETFDESLSQAARQYLEGYARVNGKVPSESEYCKALGKCGDPRLEKVYRETKAGAAKIPPMDIPGEIRAFNAKVRALNQACAVAKATPAQSQSGGVSRAYQDLLSGSSFGQLLAIGDFSEKVGKLDTKSCFGNGEGMKQLHAQRDVGMVRDSLNELVGIIGEKSKELHRQEGEFTSEADPGPGIRYFLEYEPLVLREMIRKQNSPEQAMLLCQAIEKIYVDEADRRFRSKVLGYVSFTAGIVAMVLTGGAAAPLVAAIALGMTATAVGTGIYNSTTDLRYAATAEERYEQANATGTFERKEAQALAAEYHTEKKAEQVGLALQFVPVLGKAGGRIVNKTVIQPALGSKMITVLAKSPAWKATNSATTAMTKPAAAVLAKLKAGTATVGDVLIELGSKNNPKATKAAVGLFNAATKDMGTDAALVFAATALTHPDPYSESGMLEMLEGFVKSRGISALGRSGARVLRELRLSRPGLNSVSKLNAKQGRAESIAVHSADIPAKSPAHLPSIITSEKKFAEFLAGEAPNIQTSILREVNELPPAQQKALLANLKSRWDLKALKEFFWSSIDGDAEVYSAGYYKTRLSVAAKANESGFYFEHEAEQLFAKAKRLNASGRKLKAYVDVKQGKKFHEKELYDFQMREDKTNGVLELTDQTRAKYEVKIVNGKVTDLSGKPISTRGGAFWDNRDSAGEMSSGRAGAAIFIMDPDGRIFISDEGSIGKFHHSTLAAGRPVAAAGEMEIQNGVIVRITDKSGHYEPPLGMTYQLMGELREKGADLGKAKLRFLADQ